MSIDYDGGPGDQEDEVTEPLDGLETEKARSNDAAIDLDEADLADTFELPRHGPLQRRTARAGRGCPAG